MGIYHFIVNRWVRPAIEEHEARGEAIGEARGEAIGEARGEARGRAAMQLNGRRGTNGGWTPRQGENLSMNLRRTRNRPAAVGVAREPPLLQNTVRRGDSWFRPAGDVASPGYILLQFIPVTRSCPWRRELLLSHSPQKGRPDGI